jgi:hypothetical protein
LLNSFTFWLIFFIYLLNQQLSKKTN